MAESHAEVELNGKAYLWTGSSWIGKSDFLSPPLRIQAELNALSASELATLDDNITSVRELLERAKKARVAEQLERARHLASRAHESEPENEGAASVLCGILRDCRRPAEALDIATKFPHSAYSPLLTTRAAALCDLERWREALIVLRRVISKSNGKPSEPVLKVHGRIRRGAPELFR